MPGSIRALRRRVDPIRGGGRLPLVKRRTAGRPQFREAGSDTLSAQEEAIADAVEQAVLAVPSQTVLDSLESRDYAGYGRAVLSALTDASRAIEDALLDAFVSSGETSAIDLGRELATQYRRVGKADGPSPSEVALRFRFDKSDPRATEWARTESSRLITNMARSEQEVFRALVGQTFDEARTPGSSASLIYQQLRTVTPSPTAAQFASTLGTNLNGLTTRYERAVVNRVADRAGDLYARGITGTKALEDLQKTGDKYATKLRRARSRTIARTERMMAHNQARLLSYQQAIDTGLMSRDYSRKVWSTGPFDVCPICVGMAGVEAKVADPFTLPNGTQVQAPPAHPNCRCTLQTRTNTNLYEPPSLLGSNQPGDPFRFGGRGFTPEGQQFAGRPLPGATPVAAPVDEPEIVDVAPAPPPPPSPVAIPEPPVALHNTDHFLDMIDDGWYQKTAQGRDIYTVTDTNDDFLRSIIHEQGFDARPTVVPDEQFEALWRDEYEFLYRGINAESDDQLAGYLRNFLDDDDFYVGRGLYGNGVYTTTIRETAEAYAETTGLGVAFRGENVAAVTGQVLDMALHPSSRVIDFEDLVDLKLKEKRRVLDRENELMEAQPTRQVPHPYLDDEMLTEKIPLDQIPADDPFAPLGRELERLLAYENIIDANDDVGRYAAMLGYDAIRVSKVRHYTMEGVIEDPDQYFVILNRGAVVIREGSL